MLIVSTGNGLLSNRIEESFACHGDQFAHSVSFSGRSNLSKESDDLQEGSSPWSRSVRCYYPNYFARGAVSRPNDYDCTAVVNVEICVNIG